MLKTFTEWIRRLVRDTVREELAVNQADIPIHYKDPLALTDAQRARMRAVLEDACNYCGKDVLVGRDVVLWGGRHPSHVGLELHDNVRLFDHCRLVIDQLKVPLRESGTHRAKVDIGNNVWIGANTVIRMGVSIGDDAVVEAGSVVTRDIPPRTIAFGNPARVASDKVQPVPPSRN